jgi:hypothetical protein
MKTIQLSAMSSADSAMSPTTRRSRAAARSAGNAPVAAHSASKTSTPHTARCATISVGDTCASSFQNSGTAPHSA